MKTGPDGFPYFCCPSGLEIKHRASHTCCLYPLLFKVFVFESRASLTSHTDLKPVYFGKAFTPASVATVAEMEAFHGTSSYFVQISKEIGVKMNQENGIRTAVTVCRWWQLHPRNARACVLSQEYTSLGSKVTRVGEAS